MEGFSYKFFLDLAIILFATKVFGIFARKLGIPQVVGAMIAGIIIGPVLGLVKSSTPLEAMSKIGVVLLLFSSGLGTNIKEIKENGIGSVVITLAGVIVPLGLGFIVAAMFTGGFSNMTHDRVLENLFYGVILAATSVGITVETLKELGKLKGKVGTSILSAAILDDIIGIVILSIVISLKTSGGAGIGLVFGRVGLFFVFAVVFGILGHFVFKYLAKKFPHKRRLPIFSLAVCFLFAWAAEMLFHIADITGAYIAGILLSNIQSTQYVERKVDISSYMLFSPIFFASVGINADFTGFNWNILAFGAVFVLAAIVGKVVGCGIAAKACGFSKIDSLRIGVGMMARGEVALIVAQKGVEGKLMSPANLPMVLLVILVTSFAAPIALKLLYKGRFGGAQYLGKLDKHKMETVPIGDNVECCQIEGPINLKTTNNVTNKE